MPFAAELEEITSRASWLFGDHEFSNQRRQFFQTAQDVVGFFLVLVRIDKTPVGDRNDAHVRRLGRGDAGKRVLNHKACVSMDSKFVRRAQIDVGSGFAAFNFFASNNDLEESGQLMSMQEWSRRRADRACGDAEAQFHLPQFLQHFLDLRKQADPIGKEIRRDLTATPHHFLSGHGEAKCFLVKLDREPIAHPDYVLVVFTAIRGAVTGE